MFITGLSGNGKTLMVSEVCSRLKREYVRANITVETDEDDLIGGFRLLNGETVWHDGPVVTAMKRGALLLLDEIDLASNKIMCLQPILEGSSYLSEENRQVGTSYSGFQRDRYCEYEGTGIRRRSLYRHQRNERIVPGTISCYHRTVISHQ